MGFTPDYEDDTEICRHFEELICGGNFHRMDTIVNATDEKPGIDPPTFHEVT